MLLKTSARIIRDRKLLRNDSVDSSATTVEETQFLLSDLVDSDPPVRQILTLHKNKRLVGCRIRSSVSRNRALVREIYSALYGIINSNFIRQ